MIVVYERNNVLPLASLYCFSYLRTCEQYDAHAESFGIDKIRIIYRKERREILKNIILSHLTEKRMHQYIQQQLLILIPEIDQAAFIKTLNEDLHTLAPSRIAGLGITLDQLIIWQKLQDKK